MALSKVVTRMFPTANTIGIRLILVDTDRADLGGVRQVVIDSVFTGQYAEGENMSDDVQADLEQQAQDAIDDYKALKAVFDATAYQTFVTAIDNALTL